MDVILSIMEQKKDIVMLASEDANSTNKPRNTTLNLFTRLYFIPNERLQCTIRTKSKAHFHSSTEPYPLNQARDDLMPQTWLNFLVLPLSIRPTHLCFLRIPMNLIGTRVVDA